MTMQSEGEQALRDFYDWLNEQGKNAWGSFSDFLDSIKQMTVDQALKLVNDAIKWLTDRIKQSITEKINDAFDWFNSRIDMAWKNINNNWQQVSEFVTRIWDEVSYAAAQNPAVAAAIIITIPILVIVSWKVVKGGT